MQPVIRPVATLPKAHLHLHFTGSMRPATLEEMAAKHRIRLPESLREHHLLRLTPDERGWFRFQRLYDAARACVRDADDMRRLVIEAAQDDAAEGSRWLEMQVDPTSYAPHVGGITPALEIVLDAAREASQTTGCQVAIVVAASRMRHPLDARILARLAARYAGEGAGTVVGFGLSNDERRGDTEEFAAAFRIARNAGLASVPHSGELRGPEHVQTTLDALAPDRLGHGVRSAESPEVLARVIDAGVALEVCPASNVALGVYPTLSEVPLRTLIDAGARLALGADDPLLFGPRLEAQYQAARDVHGLSDDGLRHLAASSIEASRAPDDVKKTLLAEVETWAQEPAAS
ncbi:adenosine deaminase [Kineosporia rhizophila]|uniref:adenosine deaminase n=1 Tax=Kineosporia TaxID=49184 RepID=UPI001E5ACDD9|nr:MULTISPECIES: adenosine deaminase [Kineosporia]MCE0536627.1 adenosine deaminase [Kineosporia rhizophila]GLY13229.1 adenosine deaminase [Kineosporia sp. NBRC 101677]